MAERREIEISLRSRSAERNADRLNKKVKGVGSTADDAERSMGKLSLAAAAVSAALVAGQVLRYAEAWQKVNNQLKLVTDSANDLVSTQDQLVSLAQETRAGLSGTVTLYAKLDRATKDLDISEKDLLTTVKAINQAFIISGATAVEAENAIIQLAQGLQSGSLSGDEFNSVAEQAPRLLEALSAELGKNTKELKDLGSQGKLTSELIISSLLNQSEAIDREFGKTTTLVSQGWKNLTDSLTVAVGAIDEATGFSVGLGTALNETAAIITNLTTGMNEIASNRAILNGLERWQSTLNAVGIEFDALNSKVNQYRNNIDFAETASVSFNEILKDQAIEVDKLVSGYASLEQITAGLDLFNTEGAVTNIKPEAAKPSPEAQVAGTQNTSFIDNLKAETRALQAEYLIRKQLRDGFITETQAQQMLERQNILIDYDARRQLIIEKEFETEAARQEALEELRNQELLALQNFEAQKTQISEEGVNARNRLDLLEQNARITNLQSGASAALSLLSAFGNQSFKTQKKFAIADSIINIAAGVAKALNNPYPVNLGFAAQVAAQGAALISTIKSSQPSGSSASISVSSSAPSASAQPAPAVQSQTQQRVVNITGLENFGPDDLLPLTRSQFEQFVSTDENVNIAINTGQGNAARTGAI